jgi:hypothetical protein
MALAVLAAMVGVECLALKTGVQGAQEDMLALVELVVNMV